jgi:death-on-curing protein
LAGIRDRNLLESAAAAPRAALFGRSALADLVEVAAAYLFYLCRNHPGRSALADLVEVAAAYLFYLCRNHPFNDGNKRTSMAAAIVFLRLNGIEPAPDSGEWERLVMELAASRLDREQTTIRLRAIVDAG